VKDGQNTPKPTVFTCIPFAFIQKTMPAILKHRENDVIGNDAITRASISGVTSRHSSHHGASHRGACNQTCTDRYGSVSCICGRV